MWISRRISGIQTTLRTEPSPCGDSGQQPTTPTASWRVTGRYFHSLVVASGKWTGLLVETDASRNSAAAGCGYRCLGGGWSSEVQGPDWAGRMNSKYHKGQNPEQLSSWTSNPRHQPCPFLLFGAHEFSHTWREAPILLQKWLDGSRPMGYGQHRFRDASRQGHQRWIGRIRSRGKACRLLFRTLHIPYQRFLRA